MIVATTSVLFTIDAVNLLVLFESFEIEGRLHRLIGILFRLG